MKKKLSKNIIKQKNFKKVTLLGIFVLAFGTVFSQSPAITVVPASPTAKKIERYGDYPVSLYTGVPEISIPLYEIVSGDLVIPISISYHASGFKVNDVSNPVGLGWALNAGGQISRTLRGKPDEITNTLKGFFDESFLNFHSMMERLKTLLVNVDTQPDVFFYNMGTKDGSSGRFMFDYKGRDLIPYQPLKPIFLNETNIIMDSHNRMSNLNNMSLTDDKGRLYKYGTGSNSIETTYTTINSSYLSRWMLNEVWPASRAPEDKVSFSYINGEKYSHTERPEFAIVIDSIRENSGVQLSTPPYTQPYFNYFGNYFQQISNESYKLEGVEGGYHYDYIQKNISEITFKGGRATFTYESSNKYLDRITIYNTSNAIIRIIAFSYSNYADGERKKLDRVDINNASSVAKESYKFDYDPGLGHININAQDKWGYYNGYESNYSLLQTQDVNVVSSFMGLYYPFTYTYDVTTIGAAQRATAEDGMKRYMLKKITYPTGGHTEFDFEANRYMRADSILEEVGGLRIKSISSDNGSGQLLKKEYKYGENNSGAGEVADLRPFASHFIAQSYDHYYEYNLSNKSVIARRRYYSSNANPLMNFIDGSAVYYKQVEETTVDGAGIPNGKTKYSFGIPFTRNLANYGSQFGELPDQYSEAFMGYMFPVQYAKSNWKYNASLNSFSLVDEELTSHPYVQKQAYTTGYDIHTSVNYLAKPGESEEDYENIRDIFQEEMQVTDILFYNGFSKPGDKIYNTYKDDGTLAISDTTIVEYGNTDYHAYPTRIIKRNSNGEASIQTLKYPLDYQNILNTNNLNKSINYLKSINYVSPTIEETSSVADQNLLNKQYKGGVLKLYNFDKPYLNKIYNTELLLPTTSFLESSVSAGNVNIDPSYLEKFSFDYTATGQIKEQSATRGAKVSYLWSYGGQYPIAKIENADYTTVESILGAGNITIMKNMLSPQNTDIITFLSALRSNPLLAEAQISTYTYIPFVGVNSMTDPKGKTSYYEYDDFQRLKAIKDQNGNIIKAIGYHFKP